MGLADELNRLDELRVRGVLSDSEFQRLKTRLIDGAPAPGSAPPVAAMNRLRRSLSDRWIGGVCGGLAVATGVDSWIWRLLMTLLLLFGGTGLVAYLLLWLFVPNE